MFSVHPYLCRLSHNAQINHRVLIGVQGNGCGIADVSREIGQLIRRCDVIERGCGFVESIVRKLEFGTNLNFPLRIRFICAAVRRAKEAAVIYDILIGKENNQIIGIDRKRYFAALLSKASHTV